MQAKSKRRLALAAGAFVLLAVGGIGVEQVAMGKGLSPAALAAIAKDPMSLFAGRSPGGRAEGALMLTKHKKEAPPATPGDSAEQRFPPAFPALEENPPIETAHPVEAAWENPPPGGKAVPPLAALDLVTEPLAEIPPEGLPVPPGGGGGGGGGGGCCSTTTVTGGVPEPSTWAMLILGFFSIGFALRRRNASLMTDGARA